VWQKLKAFGKVLLLVVIALGGTLGFNPQLASAASTTLPSIITTNNASLIYTPSMPVWNPYAANNMVSAGSTTTDNLPLMYFNSYAGTFLPAAVSAISEFPSNNSFVLYLRKGLYWYNGSATIPFTAWDIYTQFYIGVKAFGWYQPYMNYSLIRVLNNYEIEFTLNSWAPSVPTSMLGTVLATPYPVWKGVLANVTAYQNATVAAEHDSDIEHFVPPGWFLGPYYVSKISPPYVVWQLEPQNLLNTWDQVFPYHTWQDYSPTVIIWYTGGNGQTMNAMLAGQVTWAQVGLSPAQYKVLEGVGWVVNVLPSWGSWGILANPDVYPVNITQVRLAIPYILNQTEAADSWNAYGIDSFVPTYYATGWTQYANLPTWLRNDIRKIGVNWTKAAELLESAGFYKQNGQWYMPNGKPFTLTIQLPSGWTDVDTVVQNEASQLTEFGIPTQTFADDPSTLYGSMIPGGDFELASWYGVPLGSSSYATSWSMGWWWWTTGYYSWDTTGWQMDGNYPITFPNGTKGIFNFNTWWTDFESEVPMSAAYNQTIIWAVAFQNSQMPVIPVIGGVNKAEFNSHAFNLSWIWKLPITVEYAIYFPGVSPGLINVDNGLYYDILWGVTPPGVQSPFAEALATSSLDPSYAAFLGLPTSYSENYAQSALRSSSLTVSASPTSVVAGTATTFTATVKFANGTPVPDQSVSFQIGGATIGSTLTNSQGIASISYTPTSAGTYTVLASLTYTPAVSSSTSFTVTASSTSKKTTTIVWPSLSLQSSKSSIMLGSGISLTATAAFSNGTPASGYGVAFFVNGTQVGEATTSTSGQVTVLYTPESAGIASAVAALVANTNVRSNAVSINVTVNPNLVTKPTTTTTSSSNTTLYAIVAAVVVIVVVAVVLALIRRGGKKGSQQQK